MMAVMTGTEVTKVAPQQNERSTGEAPPVGRDLTASERLGALSGLYRDDAEVAGQGDLRAAEDLPLGRPFFLGREPGIGDGTL